MNSCASKSLNSCAKPHILDIHSALHSLNMVLIIVWVHTGECMLFERLQLKPNRPTTTRIQCTRMPLSRGLSFRHEFVYVFGSGWVSFLTYHSLCCSLNLSSLHQCCCFPLHKIIIIIFNAIVIINCYIHCCCCCCTSFLSLSHLNERKWVNIEMLSRACASPSAYSTVTECVQCTINT